MTQLWLELEARPGRARTARLTITDEGVSVSGSAFRWPDITRVLYQAVDQHVNGAYLHTSFSIGVGDARRTATFMMFSGTTGPLKTRVDHATRNAYQEQWGRAVDLVVQHAGERVVTEAVLAVRGGAAVEMSGLRLDPQGIHKGGLLRRTIAWPEYAGVRRENSYLHLLAHHGEKERSRIQVPNGAWNVALLPRVLQALTR
ncbi:MAG TPA: hypothetical protein VL738_37780 [Dactylosporangium sp.]|nr:hypothetical protein [Dactylosporangium sp.]